MRKTPANGSTTEDIHINVRVGTVLSNAFKLCTWVGSECQHALKLFKVYRRVMVYVDLSWIFSCFILGFVLFCHMFEGF